MISLQPEKGTMVTLTEAVKEKSKKKKPKLDKNEVPKVEAEKVVLFQCKRNPNGLE